MLDNDALVEVGFRLLASAQPGIHSGGGGFFLVCGATPYRRIAHGPAVLHDRYHGGVNPIKVAVLSPVLDDAGPRFASAYGGPEIGERFRRHVGMANDIMWFADKLFPVEPAHLDKGWVGEDDIAVKVGLRDQILIGAEHIFVLGYRRVMAHGFRAKLLVGWSAEPAKDRRACLGIFRLMRGSI
nr:hypothetical protein [Salinisphaera sp. LB1]